MSRRHWNPKGGVFLCLLSIFRFQPLNLCVCVCFCQIFYDFHYSMGDLSTLNSAGVLDNHWNESYPVIYNPIGMIASHQPMLSIPFIEDDHHSPCHLTAMRSLQALKFPKPPKLVWRTISNPLVGSLSCVSLIVIKAPSLVRLLEDSFYMNLNERNLWMNLESFELKLVGLVGFLSLAAFFTRKLPTRSWIYYVWENEVGSPKTTLEQKKMPFCCMVLGFWKTKNQKLAQGFF